MFDDPDFVGTVEQFSSQLETYGGPGSRPPLQLEMETYRDFYQVSEAVWRREGRIILDVKQWTRIILFPARPCSQVDCHTMCCLTALIFTAGLQMWILIKCILAGKTELAKNIAIANSWK